MKKGISAIMTMLITMVTVLVAFIIFSSLSSGAFLQEKALIGKQVGVTGEIPCTKSPNVQFTSTVDGAAYINPPKDIISTPQEADVSLKAKISSSCVEDLDITWNFGDGTSVENNCTYVPGQGYYAVDSSGNITDQDCTSMNHTYKLSLSDIWTIKDIRLQVFGLRSAFYSEAAAVGFVTDPNFNIMFAGTPDVSDYSCVLLDVISTNSKMIAINSAEAPVSDLRLDVADNKRMRSADTVTYSSDAEAMFTYRAYSADNEVVGRTNHTVQVFATKGYQTVNSTPATYIYPGSKSQKEVLLYGGGDSPGLDVYYSPRSGGSWKCVKDNSGNCAWDTFPQLKDKEHHTAVASGDVDNDGVDEIITLMQGAGSNPSEIFVFKNSEFPRTSDFRDTSLASLKDQWISADLSKETWIDVEIGNNIKVGNVVVEKGIIALSDNSLAVYQVQGGSLALIDETKLPKPNIDHWIAFTTANINNDNGGENEIIALARGKNDADKIFAFDYRDIGNITDSSDYVLDEGTDLQHKSWAGIAAGNFDGGKLKDDIVVLAGGAGTGDLAWYNDVHYDTSSNIVSSSSGLIRSFPDDTAHNGNDITWRDVTAADMNKDGIDEMLTVYESSTDNFCWFKVPALEKLDSNNLYDNHLNDMLGNLTQGKDYYCQQIDKAPSWTSIAAGDVGCFQ